MYPLLAEHIVLRNLENYILYDYKNDEIIRLDEEAFQAARYFTGRWNLTEISKHSGIELKELKIFTKDLIRDGILIDKKIINAKPSLEEETQKSPIPSLKTILVHITLRCNLNCIHCYLEEKKSLDLPLSLIRKFIPEFNKMQGLQILLSGGEPLLHPEFNEILKFVSQFPIRIMLLTNGTLITPELTDFIKKYVHEVQISIDGIESHNKFRRNDTAFSKAIDAIKLLKSVGIPIEVATMIHKDNLGELSKLGKILKDLEVESWTLDVPILTGEFVKHKNIIADLELAADALKKYGWGDLPEEETSIYACGSHICAIMPDGNVSKCAFFGDKPVENLNKESLSNCWKKIQQNYIWKKEELVCASLNCPYLEECKGGCRFRAYTQTKDFLGIDKVRCISYNFYPHKDQ